MDVLNKLGYIFTRKQKIKFLLLMIITFGGALAETVGVTLIIPFISVAANPDYIFSQPILLYLYDLLNMQSANRFLVALTLALIVIYIAKTAYLFVMYKLQYRLVYNNQMLMSAKLMDCYINKNYEYHLSKNSSEIVQGVTQDISNLFILVLNAVLLFTEAMVVLSISAFLIIINPFATIPTIALLSIIMLFFMRNYRGVVKKAGVDYQKNYASMIKWINQGIGGIKEIKVVCREDFFVNAYSGSAAKFAQSQRKYHFLNQIPRLFIEVICICTILIIVSIMLYSGINLATMLPQLAAFALAAFRIMPSFNRITGYYNAINYYKPSIDRVYKELRDSGEGMDVAVDGTAADEAFILRPDDSIKIKNLSYKYPNTDSCVLNNASFEIPIKNSVAIVGMSGGGKTTLADIFLGLLSPTSGEITVGGVKIHENKKEWSKKIGYIPQTIYLCDDSIKNNVAFGIEESEIDERKVISALEKAQLYEFIKALPQGMDTEIGERGIRLSGGQRQRIGIARAFYNDPEILVLDEATSALDNDTEAAVMDAINTVKSEKTLIIIAHRLSTIQNCDVIFKIEEGSVSLQSKKQ